jgi:hypothetical protein
MQDAFTINVSDAAAARHKADISRALLSVDAVTPHGVPRWRMRVPALVAAAMVVLPVGAAVAAESATPGDILYPVKRIVEPVVSIFNDDIVAAHRVDELARIVDDPVELDRIPTAVSDARVAVASLPLGHELRSEFRAIADRVGRRGNQDRPTTVVRPESERGPIDDQPEPVDRQVPPVIGHNVDEPEADEGGSHTPPPDTSVPSSPDTTATRDGHPPTTSDTRPPPDEPLPEEEKPPVGDHHETQGDTTTDGTTRSRTDR